MQGPYRTVRDFEVRTELARSVRKNEGNEGLVFHGRPRAIQLISSLLDGKTKHIPNIYRQFADNFPKNYFSRN